MQAESLKLVLTGPRKGQTIVLNGTEFTNGIAVLYGTPKNNDGIARYLSKCYGAQVEGSAAHRQAEENYLAAVALKEAENGTGQVHPQGNPNPPATIPAGVQSDGSGSPAPTANDGAEPASGETGTSGGVPGGDGHADTRVRPEPDGELRSVVAEAMNKLDPSNDDHWTADGKPAVAAVCEACGRNVTRQEIEIIVPDFNRDAAAKANPAKG